MFSDRIYRDSSPSTCRGIVMAVSCLVSMCVSRHLQPYGFMLHDVSYFHYTFKFINECTWGVDMTG